MVSGFVDVIGQRGVDVDRSVNVDLVGQRGRRFGWSVSVHLIRQRIRSDWSVGRRFEW